MHIELQSGTVDDLCGNSKQSHSLSDFQSQQESMPIKRKLSYSESGGYCMEQSYSRLNALCTAAATPCTIVCYVIISCIEVCFAIGGVVAMLYLIMMHIMKKMHDP